MDISLILLFGLTGIFMLFFLIFKKTTFATLFKKTPSNENNIYDKSGSKTTSSFFGKPPSNEKIEKTSVQNFKKIMPNNNKFTLAFWEEGKNYLEDVKEWEKQQVKLQEQKALTNGIKAILFSDSTLDFQLMTAFLLQRNLNLIKPQYEKIMQFEGFKDYILNSIIIIDIDNPKTKEIMSMLHEYKVKHKLIGLTNDPMRAYEFMQVENVNGIIQKPLLEPNVLEQLDFVLNELQKEVK